MKEIKPTGRTTIGLQLVSLLLFARILLIFDARDGTFVVVAMVMKKAYVATKVH